MLEEKESIIQQKIGIVDEIEVKKSENEKTAIVARVLSYAFHPIFTVVYGFLIILHTDSILLFIPQQLKVYLIITIIVSTIGLPLVSIGFLKWRKLIKSIEYPNKSDRIVMLLIMALFYYVCYYLVKSINLPIIYVLYMLGLMISIILSMSISVFYKISLHAIGWGTLLASIIGISYGLQIDLFLEIILITIISGIVGSIRLWAKAHSFAEVLVGYLIGFIPVFLLYFIYFR